MAKSKNSYLCPGCERFEGKWRKIREHMQGCCPSKLQGVSKSGGGVKKKWLTPSSIAAAKDRTGKKGDGTVGRIGILRRSKRKRGGGEDASQHSAVLSRVPVRLSARNDELAVKTVDSFACHAITKKGKKSKRNKCHCRVDDRRLFVLRCIRCDRTHDMSNDKAEYLWCRRRTRKILGLLTVSAPLDGRSTRILADVARSCGIASNTSVAHLTYVEGLLPDEGRFDSYLDGLKSLRVALRVDPSMEVTAIHRVPRSSDVTTVLIVADVSVSAGSRRASEALRRDPGCVLPQFPLHIALGACPKSDSTDVMMRASSRLTGRSLALNGSQLSVLPPPLDEKVGGFPYAPAGAEREAALEAMRADRLKTNAEKFPAAVAARGAADKLNGVLSSASMFTWSRSGSSDSRAAIEAPRLAFRETSAGSTSERRQPPEAVAHPLSSMDNSNRKEQDPQERIDDHTDLEASSIANPPNQSKRVASQKAPAGSSLERWQPPEAVVHSTSTDNSNREEHDPPKRVEERSEGKVSTYLACPPDQSSEGRFNANDCAAEHLVETSATVPREFDMRARMVTTKDGDPICWLCKRRFTSIEKLQRHETKSEMHRTNLAKAESLDSEAQASES